MRRCNRTVLSLVVAATLLPRRSSAWCSRASHLYSEKRPRGNQRTHHHRRREPPSCTACSLAARPTAASTPPASAPSTSVAAPRHTLHLISLPATDDTHALPGEALVRECWRWKDTALGFRSAAASVPRPRALTAFQAPFVGLEATVRGDGDGWEVTLRPPPGCDGDAAATVRLPASRRPRAGACAAAFVVEECAALSTCARLDVLLVLRTDGRRDGARATEAEAEAEAAEAAARCAVAYRLRQQIVPERAKEENSLFLRCLAMAARLGAQGPDMPEPDRGRGAAATAPRRTLPLLPPCSSEDTRPVARTPTERGDSESTAVAMTQQPTLLMLPPASDETSSSPARVPPHGDSRAPEEEAAEVRALGQRLASLAGARAIATHLALVAAGLAPHPARPERKVRFRPYAAADAHILFQLKRTAEVVSAAGAAGAAGADGRAGGGRGRIKNLLDAALRAGKAARNDDVVPEIQTLRESGADGTPPAALAAVAAEAAVARAVEPAVAACAAKLAAMDAGTAARIAGLRRRVHDRAAALAGDGPGDGPERRDRLRRRANALLHAPTRRLREGRLSRADVEAVACRIEEQLAEV